MNDCVYRGLGIQKVAAVFGMCDASASNEVIISFKFIRFLKLQCS